MSDKSPGKSSAVPAVGKFLGTLFAEFQQDQCLIRAAGLAFATLLALVPLSALLLMIVLIPSGRVRGSSALVGAAAGVVLWELARRIFFLWITYVLRMSVVYGSLAVVPIFLIWLYVAWSVVLLALEIAYVHQHRRFAWLGRSPMQVSPGERLLFGLEVFLDIAGRFHRGEGPPSREEIARRLNASVSEVSYFTDVLHENGLVLFAGPESDRLLPARSLDRISLQGLLLCLFGGSARPAERSGPAVALYHAVTDAASGSLAERTVLDFLKSGIAPADGS